MLNKLIVTLLLFASAAIACGQPHIKGNPNQVVRRPMRANELPLEPLLMDAIEHYVPACARQQNRYPMISGILWRPDGFVSYLIPDQEGAATYELKPVAIETGPRGDRLLMERSPHAFDRAKTRTTLANWITVQTRRVHRIVTSTSDYRWDRALADIASLPYVPSKEQAGDQEEFLAILRRDGEVLSVSDGAVPWFGDIVVYPGGLTMVVLSGNQGVVLHENGFRVVELLPEQWGRGEEIIRVCSGWRRFAVWPEETAAARLDPLMRLGDAALQLFED